MAKISNTTVYPSIIPDGKDYFILTDAQDNKQTKTCNVQSLKTFIIGDLQTLVVTLAPSQILNSFTTPVILLTAAAGEYIQVVSSSFFLDFNTIPYSVFGNSYLTNNGSLGSQQGTITGIGSSADFASTPVAIGGYSYPLSGGGNNLTFQSATADPTNGDSPVTLNLLYRIAKF